MRACARRRSPFSPESLFERRSGASVAAAAQGNADGRQGAKGPEGPEARRVLTRLRRRRAVREGLPAALGDDGTQAVVVGAGVEAELLDAEGLLVVLAVGGALGLEEDLRGALG